MQSIIVDKPYHFIPPVESRFWPPLLRRILPRYLRRSYGVEAVECRGAEKLTRSLAEGKGVLLAPNHSRDCDPLVLGNLSAAAGCEVFVMASWHLFMQGAGLRWVLRRAGAFSVYREGMDRAALQAATEILETGRRPLVLFPEGMVSGTNGRLNPLMEGTALIARSAAKKRAKAKAPPVVVHPVALSYKYLDDPERALPPVLEDIERRLSWRPLTGLPLLERISKVGQGLLALKELEYAGAAGTGPIPPRLDALIDRMLSPLEAEWCGGQKEGGVLARVKRLRAAILPAMTDGELPEAERARRWKHLADVYLAQQLLHYPPDYVRQNPTPERLAETVGSFAEDLTDVRPPCGAWKASIEVGDAVEVAADVEGAALMETIRAALAAPLGISA